MRFYASCLQGMAPDAKNLQIRKASVQPIAIYVVHIQHTFITTVATRLAAWAVVTECAFAITVNAGPGTVMARLNSLDAA